MTYPFEKASEDGVILVSVKLDGIHSFKMVLDTAASHTTIDFSALRMEGYEFEKASQKCLIETANGVIEADVYKIESLTALGRSIHHIPVQVYDFISHGVLSDYDGMLGLDFFENTVFCIDMVNCTIEINPDVTSNQNSVLQNQNATLSNEVAGLRQLLQEAGIPIPPNLN
jgi:hypothetical protein